MTGRIVVIRIGLWRRIAGAVGGGGGGGGVLVGGPKKPQRTI